MQQKRPMLEMMEARDQGYFNIGQAAAASGVSAKMIRHYEKIGVIPAAGRTFANYRIYTSAEVHTLRFVRRARKLGFSMVEIEALVRLWQDRRRSSATVKKLAQKHADELEAKIREMQAMQRTLRNLVEHCHGDSRPECPILDDLAGEAAHDEHCAPSKNDS